MRIQDLDVTVDTVALRQAIAAVSPHADPDPKWPRLHRVRAYVGTDAVVLSASDGQTGALASVDLVERPGVLGCFDLLPDDARELSRLFKPTKEEAESGGAALRFQVTEKDLVCTDVGGMFPGKSLTLNATPVDEMFPNVAKVLRAIEAGGRLLDVDDGYRTSLAGRHLGKFVQAATAYGEILTIAHGSRALLVVCGRSFIGVLVPARQDPDVYQRALRRWRLHRFDEVTRNHPDPPPTTPVKSATSGEDGVVTTAVTFAGTAGDVVVDLTAWLAGVDGQVKPPKGKGKGEPAAAVDDPEPAAGSAGSFAGSFAGSGQDDEGADAQDEVDLDIGLGDPPVPEVVSLPLFGDDLPPADVDDDDDLGSG